MSAPVAWMTFDSATAQADVVEREEFERRMNAAWPTVARLVRRLLAWPGRAADVDDVVQDVFLAAWRGRDQFRGDSEWSTWVYRIAVHRSRNAARARLRRLRLFDWLPWPDAEPAQESGGERDGDTALRAELARLPHRDREVLVLRYLEELQVEDIMAQLDLNRAAVDARLSRARRRLRARLAVAEGGA